MLPEEEDELLPEAGPAQDRHNGLQAQAGHTTLVGRVKQLDI